jgi:hypothetical protein
MLPEAHVHLVASRQRRPEETRLPSLPLLRAARHTIRVSSAHPSAAPARVQLLPVCPPVTAACCRPRLRARFLAALRSIDVGLRPRPIVECFEPRSPSLRTAPLHPPSAARQALTRQPLQQALDGSRCHQVIRHLLTVQCHPLACQACMCKNQTRQPLFSSQQ